MANLQPQSDRSAGDVETHIAYLARDGLFLKEKPYGADFPVDHFKGAKLANHTFEKVPVVVRNARGRENDFTLERNGFCFLQAKTSLTAEEASNEKTPTMARYLEEIERILYKSFPEYARIEVMDFQVRKRHPGFPEAIGTRVEFEQPAAMPHTDFSVDGAYMRMREAFPGQEKHYERKSFDLLNVWRVLCGPNNDWPLGLCDFQSIDMERDTLPNDCLHQTRVGENWLLTSHKGHVWYYLSDQLETDLIVFRNTDSEGARARAFHSAFKNPMAQGMPRHSVEVRAVAFR